MLFMAFERLLPQGHDDPQVSNYSHGLTDVAGPLFAPVGGRTWINPRLPQKS